MGTSCSAHHTRSHGELLWAPAPPGKVLGKEVSDPSSPTCDSLPPPRFIELSWPHTWFTPAFSSLILPSPPFQQKGGGVWGARTELTYPE